MRNFFEYVEKTKEETVGMDSTDVLLEGFKEDLMRVETNLDPVSAIILGFLAGSGIDLKKNKAIIKKMLQDKETSFSSPSQVIKNLVIDEKSNVDEIAIRKAFAKGLTQLRSILRSEEKMS